MILASGARQILDARMQGMKPAELIIVSLIGPTQEPNKTVYANPAAAYDWRWTQGLEVCIYANSKTDWRPTAQAIVSRRPKGLYLWDVDRFEGCEVYSLPLVEDIDKPASQWRYSLHFIPWCSIQNREFAFGGASCN